MTPEERASEICLAFGFGSDDTYLYDAVAARIRAFLAALDKAQSTKRAA